MEQTIAPKLSVIADGGVASPAGIHAGGIHAGFRRDPQRFDLALVEVDECAVAAGAFTTNKFCAAPVTVSRAHLGKGGSAPVRAVCINSGNANAATGEEGLECAEATCALVAKTIGCEPEQVLVASTGVIGQLLDVAPFETGVPALHDKICAQATDESLRLSGGHDAARAIMTTDTHPKEYAVSYEAGGSLAGSTVTVGGMCKGSGMIEPNMATMLGFITTDAAIAPALLRRALRRAVAVSFNHVVVDGDESTNDSVFLLASGAAGNAPIVRPGDDFEAFVAALTAVGVALAKQMAADGEGATKYVEVRVVNAKTQRDADRAARAIAKSPLAKTSWFGKDPNWGRVLAAAGYSGAQVDDRAAEVFYGKTWAYRRGEVADAAQLAKLEKEMQGPELVVTVDLHLGTFAASIYTCDLSLDYVHINADYTT